MIGIRTVFERACYGPKIRASVRSDVVVEADRRGVEEVVIHLELAGQVGHQRVDDGVVDRHLNGAAEFARRDVVVGRRSQDRRRRRTAARDRGQGAHHIPDQTGDVEVRGRAGHLALKIERADDQARRHVDDAQGDADVGLGAAGGDTHAIEVDAGTTRPGGRAVGRDGPGDHVVGPRQSAVRSAPLDEADVLRRSLRPRLLGRELVAQLVLLSDEAHVERVALSDLEARGPQVVGQEIRARLRHGRRVAKRLGVLMLPALVLAVAHEEHDSRFGVLGLMAHLVDERVPGSGHRTHIGRRCRPSDAR